MWICFTPDIFTKNGTFCLDFYKYLYKVERWDVRGVTFLNINRSKTRRETLFISLRDPARTLEQSRVIGMTPAGGRYAGHKHQQSTSTINNLVSLVVSLVTGLLSEDQMTAVNLRRGRRLSSEERENEGWSDL